MDTIELILPASEVPNTDLLGEIPVHLSNVGHHNYEGGISVSGRLGRLVVGVTDGRVKVSGSLPKWYLGNNLQMIDRNGIHESIVRMSDMLHLPMDRAQVKEFHYAENLEMNYSPDLYFRYLGPNGHYRRYMIDDTLYYKLSGKTLVYYDKIKEYKSHKEPVPRQFKGIHLFRYEKRYLWAAKCFKRDKLTAAMLYEPDFYQAIKEDWYKDYLSIWKIRKPMINFNIVKTKKQFASMSELAFIESNGGVQKMLLDLDEGRKTRRLSRKQVCDLKKEVTIASNNKQFTCESELITELDMKMAEAMAIKTNNKFRSNGMEDYNWYPGI